MFILIGLAIVFASTIGGFMMAGGNPGVLIHVSEFVVILGIALGVLVISTPIGVIKEMVHKLQVALAGKTDSKDSYMELMKMLYEVFMVGRRNGLVALEEHVMNPGSSAIFNKYPAFTSNHTRMDFLINGLKPVIDGKIKPDQLETLLNEELKAKAEEASHPVHAYQMIADALPAIGIVAAVLGIINTMSSIADGPEAVGAKVAAALTGTMLGIFVSYGMVNPLATRIMAMDAADGAYLRCIVTAVSGFAKGLAPITAVEIARRTVSHDCQPGAEELETILKAIK
ncbi:MAG: MotA/TolQ/ExbB proton channel family protein [Verrucomicrobia bacterium]|nr:MotA/TolQ/ExbB proton channel family protein [Verrucomicrobiota bacterium]